MAKNVVNLIDIAQLEETEIAASPFQDRLKVSKRELTK